VGFGCFFIGLLLDGQIVSIEFVLDDFKFSILLSLSDMDLNVFFFLDDLSDSISIAGWRITCVRSSAKYTGVVEHIIPVFSFGMRFLI